MKITLKFYTTLKDYLPEGTKDNAAEIEVEDGASVQSVVERQGVPTNMIHMTLVNGAYVTPGDFASHTLKDGDTLAMWPPLAGG
ncbi:MAG: MoaD/ThiS family protein [Alphaproteobacteria bacterium]|nr:MoaD/ThiS family protein [Alphaproteobacteria bacterium]